MLFQKAFIGKCRIESLLAFKLLIALFHYFNEEIETQVQFAANAQKRDLLYD